METLKIENNEKLLVLLAIPGEGTTKSCYCYWQYLVKVQQKVATVIGNTW
jgi:hypothetical protein